MTIGIDIDSKKLSIDGVSCRLKIIGTEDQEQFPKLGDSYFKGVHAVMLVYDVCDRFSFEEVPRKLKNIVESVQSGVKVMLVGNVTDGEDRREIMIKQGEELANQCGCLFAEVSIKDPPSVDAAFETLTKRVLIQRNILPNEPPPMSMVQRIKEKLKRDDQNSDDNCSIF